MAGQGTIAKLKNISDSGGNLPNPPLTLPSLPPEIVKAFPSMAEWEKQANAQLAEWVQKTNTAQQQVT